MNGHASGDLQLATDPAARPMYIELCYSVHPGTAACIELDMRHGTSALDRPMTYVENARLLWTAR